MSEKPKCKLCNERDIFSKEMCSGCYGREWRRQRKLEREVVVEATPKQLTGGITDNEPAIIEGEIVHDTPSIPETHLVATSPAQMQAAQGDLRAYLEEKLATIEREIIEANAALNEARRNSWSTTALTSARNRLVDDETYYNKVLAAVEAGHTIIPDFPVEVFAIRRAEDPRQQTQTYTGIHNATSTGMGQPVPPDYAPAGAGSYRNPQPATWDTTRENTHATPENKQPRYYTTVTRYGHPVGPITFPLMTARSPIMRATAAAMKDKVFDQIGVCHPVIADAATAARRADTRARRLGDPLVIGQVLRKRVGSQQKCTSFIIAWYLNLEEL